MALTKWMQSLFEDKLAAQKEALQDVKQLADIIAAQQTHSTSMYEGTTHDAARGMMSAPGSTASIPPQKRSARGHGRRGRAAWRAAGVGGFLYMRHTAAVAAERAEVDAKARELAAQQQRPDEAKGSLDVKSTPDGCAIWINGDLREQVTPAKIENLPFNRELKLKLTKEGFEAYRESVTLTDGAANKAIAAEMKAGSVTVMLKVEPQPTAWLDGKPWKGDKNKLDGISAGEEHKLVLAASGYQPKTITFTAQQGETKVVTEKLVKADPSASAAAPDKPAGGGDAPAAAAGPGKVRVGAKGGFCTVTINGTSYGPTPVEATVPAGNARVSCKPASGPAMSQGVKVEAGGTARVSFKIE